MRGVRGRERRMVNVPYPCSTICSSLIVNGARGRNRQQTKTISGRKQFVPSSNSLMSTGGTVGTPPQRDVVKTGTHQYNKERAFLLNRDTSTQQSSYIMKYLPAF